MRKWRLHITADVDHNMCNPSLCEKTKSPEKQRRRSPQYWWKLSQFLCSKAKLKAYPPLNRWSKLLCKKTKPGVVSPTMMVITIFVQEYETRSCPPHNTDDQFFFARRQNWELYPPLCWWLFFHTELGAVSPTILMIMIRRLLLRRRCLSALSKGVLL